VGRADDLLATVLCASDAPVLLAPAMNQAMWRDQANQTNLQRLAERGYRTVGPGEGAQACGDTGAGRMSEAVEIAQAVADCFASGILDGRHVVITAGPSLEALDPVRYLSNYSSGKMGFALATAAIEAGAKVTLIAGPVHLQADARAQRVDVVSAQDMLEAVMGVIDGADIFVGAAAVADFRPVTSESQKIKKTAAAQTLTLELEKTPDIIAAVSNLISPPVVVGFAAETHDLLEHANAKMQRKNLQMIVANDVSRDDIGFSSDSNEVIVLTRSEQVEMPKMSKDQLARELIKLIAQQV
jgi:phosphopantothenoylcysteine decarboxylase/phosphopantothenate--cysteine ligase